MQTTTWLTLIFDQMLSSGDPGPMSFTSGEALLEEFPANDVPDEVCSVLAETKQNKYIGTRDANRCPCVSVEKITC